MTTALQLMTTALRKINAYSIGETIDSDVSADGLALLNGLLDAWAIDRLLVYQVVQASYSWASGNVSRTIGSGGNFSATRPSRVESAFVNDTSGKYELEIIRDRLQYDRTSITTDQSELPTHLYYEASYPLGTLYAYPVPSATFTLLLNTWQTLQSFSSNSDALSLPSGYQRALEFNLAVEWAPEFGREASESVQRIARETKAAIMRLNAPTPIMTIDPMLSGATGQNILRGA